jgi:ribosomal protein S18 acetylase RimI-like enzyme
LTAQSTQFRHFRNFDPPALAAVWKSLAGQPELNPKVGVEVFEQFILAKPYFDPEGLILACEGEEVIGFAHAGFGSNDTEDGISVELGTTIVLLVRPDRDQARVAAGLLEQCESYLRKRGTKVIYGGGIRPMNGFYLGLYGGSELPGVPDTDTVAQQALLARGYREIDRTLRFRRGLNNFEAVVDRRQMQVRRQMIVEVVVDPTPRTWWDACTLSTFDLVRFSLIPHAGGAAVATATFRRMELVPTTLQPSSSGLIEIWVEESARRRGLAVFLLSEAFRQFIREGTREVEVQAMQHNLAAHALYRKMGFQQIGQGSVYRKE